LNDSASALPPLIVLGQAGERLVHLGQVRGPVIGLGQAHAASRVRTTCQWLL